ncbi:hypothetical protein VKT23_020759 [Stygiomarasmius scandens]
MRVDSLIESLAFSTTSGSSVLSDLLPHLRTLEMDINVESYGERVLPDPTSMLSMITSRSSRYYVKSGGRTALNTFKFSADIPSQGTRPPAEQWRESFNREFQASLNTLEAGGMFVRWEI